MKKDEKDGNRFQYSWFPIMILEQRCC